MSWDSYTLAIKIQRLEEAARVHNSALRNMVKTAEYLVEICTRQESALEELERRIAELEVKNN